jgi:hypothetical protein
MRKDKYQKKHIKTKEFTIVNDRFLDKSNDEFSEAYHEHRSK